MTAADAVAARVLGVGQAPGCRRRRISGALRRPARAQYYDGREVLANGATELPSWVSDVDRSAPGRCAEPPGQRSIGYRHPAKILEVVHNEHGRTPWLLFDGNAADGDLTSAGAAISSPQLCETTRTAELSIRRRPETRGERGTQKPQPPSPLRTA